MLKSIKLWSLVLMALCLSAFLAGGCGGSADSSDNTTIENDSPNTFDTNNILNGTWIVIDQDEISVSVESGDNTIDMQLITASITFSNTNINDTSGLSFATIHETWHAFLDADTRIYLGIKAINLDNQVMSLMKSGADQWRCELYDQYRTILNISVLSQNIIQVEEHRIAQLDGIGIEYDVTFTMRKQQ